MAYSSSRSSTSTVQPSLSQVLSHLTPKILTTDPHSTLRFSPFERTKTAHNLEYARTLLLRAEHNAAGIKVQSKKHAVQEQLVKQRALIKRLNDRLFELGQLDNGQWGTDDDDEDDDGDGDQEEDRDVDEILRAVLEEDNDNDMSPKTPRTPKSSSKPEVRMNVASRSKPPQQPVESERAALLGPAGLRARSKQTTSASQGKSTGTATGITTTTNNNGKPDATQSLQSQESLHADLTSSLVGLATQLKLSAQSFSDDLGADNEQLTSTENALGKNKGSLDSATGRMGVLRKMSEGRWWWGRMALYAAIAALWVVLLLFVFIGPKIRF